MARPGGLGRGLGALIPTGTVAEQAGGLADIPTAEIRPNPQQPREHFDEEALAALADSIREVGVLQPVLVRVAEDGGYELIAGERRWRAGATRRSPDRARDGEGCRRRGDAPTCHRREHPAGGTESAGGSRRVPAVDRGFLADPRRCRDSGRQESGDDHEHAATAAVAAVDSTESEGRHDSHGARPRVARNARPRAPGAAGQAGRRRGSLGPPGRRGDPRPPRAPHSQERDRSRGRQSRRSVARRPGCWSSRSCSATTSRPESGSRWALATAGCRSSSPTSKTWNASTGP